ncbi:spheroidene monooxygenase [Cognatiyoonia sp. IB215182]|uniref:spheroidene monooxygenase n=1 Tax=Cognatiyoonia sp. IB215182 TaxID=3097353 RepID=UPI002A0CBC39|nr:spheroidene monooxygenase [Cognatiyoonia sp. IB215182]MDX8353183.1 spheroidene monooxygenase [Cognatiyoonia sp. IB215182]
MTQTVSLSFYRFSGFAGRVWALMMMGAARRPLARMPDIGFWKLCGSGTGEGFTPVPNTGVYAILATWPDAETARARTQEGIFARYTRRADENWTVFLTTQTARGQWSGQAPFEVSTPETTGPLAALTRATIKPRILTRFWGRVPNISAMIGTDPNVAFKIGIGEVPMLHQVTFSIWPSERAMAAFARTGPHAEAIRAVRDEGWFREELYARFAVHSDRGTWNGSSPLKKLEAA